MGLLDRFRREETDNRAVLSPMFDAVRSDEAAAYHYNVAVTLTEQGMYEEAFTEFKQVVRQGLQFRLDLRSNKSLERCD
jgi:hypothetical protein